MNHFRSVIFFEFLFLLFSQSTFAQIKVPALWNMRVHDDAKVLSQQTIDYLENRLKIFEDSTTNQIAILIVPSLDGEDIEGFGIRLAKEWKLGTAGKDNGIILILAINDRKMRIEVGHGLKEPCLMQLVIGSSVTKWLQPSVEEIMTVEKSQQRMLSSLLQKVNTKLITWLEVGEEVVVDFPSGF